MSVIRFVWCLVIFFIGYSSQSKLTQNSLLENQRKLNEVIQAVVGAIRPKEEIDYNSKNRFNYTEPNLFYFKMFTIL